MKTYAPRHDDAERSPWRRPTNRRPTPIEAVIAELDERRIDAREYAELARDLALDEESRVYRTRAAAAAHRAAALAAYLEREQPRA